MILYYTVLYYIAMVLYCTFFSELRWGKAMVANTMPQQRKKEESEKLRGEGDQIKFIHLGFERWQFVGFSELC